MPNSLYSVALPSPAPDGHPNPLPRLVCTRAPAAVITYLIERGPRGVTAAEVAERYGVNATSAVSRLRDIGAYIDTYPAPTRGRVGQRDPGETRYVYAGWDPAAPKRFPAHFSVGGHYA